MIHNEGPLEMQTGPGLYQEASKRREWMQNAKTVLKAIFLVFGRILLKISMISGMPIYK